ncbi:MAG: RHS repeat protein, partial [Cyanothece sp. SIO1E1]|nr:RHS repeat protein [Cyanothece sp. SIO1E1]
DGTLEFTPKPDQLGAYEFTVIATDGVLETSQTLTLNVVADTVTTTRVSGVIQNTDQQPLAGVVVEIGNLQTTTAADGSFTLAVDGALPGDTLFVRGEQITGAEVYPFIAEKLPLVLGQAVFEGVNNVIDRPIYLPALDVANGQVIDPAVDTVVTTAAIPGAAVAVAAGSLEMQQGEEFAGTLSITAVPNELTPAALPPNLVPDLVVTIQPGEMVFTTPAPLSLPNLAGYAPGTLMDLWSINPNTGDFDKVGIGQVSTDGTVVETIEGGIRNSSWHFFIPLLADPANNSRNPDDEGHNCPFGLGFNSEVELHSGAVVETHDLVSYQSLGTERGLSLTYDSLRADPRPILHFGYDSIPFNANQRLIAELTIKQGDFEYQVPGYTGGEYGLDGGEHFWSIPEAGGDIGAALQADLRGQASGRYEYELISGIRQFTGGRFAGASNTSTGNLLHINSADSPFGSGWGLAGVQQLVENEDGSILLIDGDGSELLFEAAAESPGAYVAPPGDFSSLERLPDGTFRRTLKDQTVYSFNSNNRLVLMADRNGNETRHVYNAAEQLTQIIDPVGLETTFTYTGRRVTQITDPTGRVTQLAYDAAGNLRQVTDPDGTTRTWEYDSQHHMTAEIDQRGNREQAFYDFAGRASHSIRKDGSTIQVSPLQTQGLYRPDATLDPFQAPDAYQSGAAEAFYVDGNGNTRIQALDQGGQITSSSDGAGNLPGAERNDDNLVTQQIDGRGNITHFTYDDQGNLLSVRDGLSGGDSIGGFIAQPGEQDRYNFSLSEDTTLYFDSLTNTRDIRWTLEGPAGVVVDQRPFDLSDRFSVNDPQLHLVAGDYTLTIDAIGDVTGDYQFRLLDLAEAQTITPGIVVNDGLDESNQTKLYQFEVETGEQFFFDFQAREGANNAAWRLIDPYGNIIFGQNFNQDIDTLTLEKTGIYSLLIEGFIRDSGSSSYSFNVEPVVNTLQALEFGSTISNTISLGEQAQHTFSLSQDATLYFDSLTDTRNITWSVLTTGSTLKL